MPVRIVLWSFQEGLCSETSNRCRRIAERKCSKVGRRGKTLTFTITFDRSDFHHLAGLHKLRDNVRFQTGKRSDIMQEILVGRLTFSHAQRSAFFNEMESRLLPLTELENFLDNNNIIFRYNSKANTFSAIQANYLLQNDYEGIPVYLFLAQRSGENTQVCRTFFPKTSKDYTQGPPQYTLLKKEKHNMITGEIVIQYDRLTPSPNIAKKDSPIV